jgi:D-alanyl-D-alanine carboxypeptidase
VRRAAAGLAEIEDRRPMTVDARFRTASVTKSFVAVVVLQLVAEGRLGLDDPARRWLGELPRDITVRRLLRHTSGLADYLDDPAVLASQRRAPARAWSPRALVRNAAAQPRTGGRVDYSSTNYLALGLVLEAAAREPIDELLRRHVFERFRLGGTTFEPGRVRGAYLHGHERASRDGIATGRLRDTHERTARSAWAAGAAVSTAADLDVFFTRVLAGPLGRSMRPRGDDRYGLGLARFATNCGPVVGHTGNLLGTITVVWTRGDRVLIVAANAFPLTPEQETRLQLLLTRAFCGQA